MTTDPLVDDYLRRLDAAAAVLPRHRRVELLAEIREHVDNALSELDTPDEVAVRNVLERLGAPEEIVEEAGPIEERRRAGALEIVALVVLAVGFIVPVVGWIAGATLVLASGAWSTRDKLVGLAIAGLATVAFVAALGLPFGIGLWELLVLWGLGGPIGAAYLGWRLRRRPSRT